MSVLYLPKDWLELFSSKVVGESESVGRDWRRFMAIRECPVPAAMRTGCKFATASVVAFTMPLAKTRSQSVLASAFGAGAAWLCTSPSRMFETGIPVASEMLRRKASCPSTPITSDTTKATRTPEASKTKARA